ncbi:hypothetical protein [Nannocystis punicea]|uniref:Cytochrome c domain-containing protein n=1 Tax=Nannocystis punicea TaxID=2995304 RepID=A0ABY7HD36_9BACT|nr:hypothetical protein [Nannocystis poenicansa]WAS97038.1 hypothetical protein O0S08_12890 [Nannocystis poenicansa]
MAGLLALAAACNAGAPTPGPATTDASTSKAEPSTGEPIDTTGPTTGEPLPPVTACAEATSLAASPRTIGEAVAFINELPQPLTLDCFLERLERPLAIAATRSVISLQPAVGESSPRLFLFMGELVMSVAVDGHGFDLLEFGELVGPTRSIKAEIAFPLAAPIAPDAPFSRIFDGVDGTGCGVCHGGEAPAPAYPQAFVSDALRFPDFEAVKFTDLRGEYERCDPAAQPERCARLTALFGHGAVEPAAFPETMPTIYDYE